MIRGLLVGLMFSFICFAPWWAAFVPALLLSIRWTAYEVIAAGVLADLLYLPSGGFFGVPFIYSLSSLVIVGVFAPLRRQLSINTRVI